jgi:hypothetical protein
MRRWICWECCCATTSLLALSTIPEQIGQLRGQALAHAQQRTWTAMFEYMQTAVQHVRREVHAALLERLEQFTDMRSPMRKIQDEHRLKAMQVNQALQLIGSIGHSTHLLVLHHLASSHLHFGQVGKGLSISQT